MSSRSRSLSRGLSDDIRLDDGEDEGVVASASSGSRSGGMHASAARDKDLFLQYKRKEALFAQRMTGDVVNVRPFRFLPLSANAQASVAPGSEPAPVHSLLALDGKNVVSPESWKAAMEADVASRQAALLAAKGTPSPRG